MRVHDENTEIWRFETARYVISCHALEEDLDSSDSFERDDDIEFARQGGSHWFAACVRVVNKETGLELGVDHLGGCSYNSFREFITGHREGGDDNRNTLAMKARNTVICHYFPDMVREAIAAARTTLEKLCCAKHA